MTNERLKRMLTLLATLAAAAVFAAGCGDDDNNDGGGGGGGNLGETTNQQETTQGTDTPSNKDEVIDRCFEEADKLDGEAKDRAREACEAAEKGEIPDTSIPEDAKKKCLEAAEQVPDEAQREQAKNACALLE